MFGWKKQQLPPIEPPVEVPKSHVKLVNFYSVIFDDRIENRPLSGVLLDYAGKEFEFEWDETQDQLASIVCPNDDIKSLRWELAERFLAQSLGVYDNEQDVEVEVRKVNRETRLEQVVPTDFYQPQNLGPPQEEEVTFPPVGNEPGVVSPEAVDDEEEDFPEELLSSAFKNLDTVQDVLGYENVDEEEEEKEIVVGDRVSLREDPMVKGMVKMIKDGRAQVFVDSQGNDMNVPLMDLKHVE